MKIYNGATSRGRVKLAIFDWAGTTVDFGCQAPVEAFVAGFKAKGIEMDALTARGPMGMEKRDHIKKLTELPVVVNRWREVHGRAIHEEDIDSMYNEFVPHLLAILKDKTRLIPGVRDASTALKKMGIKIGSTTGYFKEAADLVSAAAAEQGFRPEVSVCSTDVAHGRPHPWMIYRVMEAFNIYPPAQVVNIGDTEVDMKAAQNAGVWAVGVAATGNEMGLTETQLRGLDSTTRNLKLAAIQEKLYEAGAHWVIDTLDELPSIIEEIDNLLENGHTP
jgi:phosphonoacetaldehyde hydrolase